MTTIDEGPLQICAIIPSLRPDSLRLTGLIRDLARCGISPLVVANGEQAKSICEATDALVLSTGSNQGFGRAINWAASAVGKFDLMLILNDDTVIDCNEFLEAVRKILATAESRSKLFFLDVEASRPLPNLWQIFLNLSLLSRAFASIRRPTPSCSGILLGKRYKSFSAVMIGQDAWTLIGGFDGSLPFTYEDADMVRRLQSEGVECLQIESSGITHLHSVTSASLVDYTLPVSAWSAYLYGRKWCQPRYLVKPVCICALVVRVAFASFGRASLVLHLRGIWRAICTIVRSEEPELPAYENGDR